MSGGRGSKAPAEQPTVEEAELALAAEPDFKAHLQQAQAALCAGFLPWLEQRFPDRWDPTGWKVQNNQQVCDDIEHVSGYKFDLLCAEQQDSYAAQKAAFDAFAKEHFSRPEQLPGGDSGVFAYHGSSRASVQAIHEKGFDSSRWKEGVYGNGGYVSTLLTVALAYAPPEFITPTTMRVFAAYGRAHIGDPREIPVGTKGQTDFGVREDGTSHMTLTNPVRTYYCLREPRQFLASGFMGFEIRIDQRPSDFALRNMFYHPAVWHKMTECIPGLVAYKNNLLSIDKANKERADRLRQRHKRQAEGDEGPAKRTRGA